MWYGGLNDEREAVGYSETSVPDPNGEDVCAFGTGLTCSAFLWKNGSMSALPTLGGNNGQASAINNHGQIAGYAENGIVDGTCPTTFRNNRIDLPVLWENGNAQPLPTVGRDPDGVAFGINNQGQATGYSGTCTLANHAVLWENDFAVPLPDLGVPGASEGFGINDLGEGINNQGQAVGSTLDSNGNWSHAFLWQNGVMTDLNTLLPASSNLYATMANQINDRGQISGMAVVLSGPEVGTIHAFLATPVNASVGMSVAEVARTHPKITLPANVGNQLLQRLRLGQFGR